MKKIFFSFSLFLLTSVAYSNGPEMIIPYGTYSVKDFPNGYKLILSETHSFQFMPNDLLKLEGHCTANFDYDLTSTPSRPCSGGTWLTVERDGKVLDSARVCDEWSNGLTTAQKDDWCGDPQYKNKFRPYFVKDRGGFPKRIPAKFRIDGTRAITQNYEYRYNDDLKKLEPFKVSRVLLQPHALVITSLDNTISLNALFNEDKLFPIVMHRNSTLFKGVFEPISASKAMDLLKAYFNRPFEGATLGWQAPKECILEMKKTKVQIYMNGPWYEDINFNLDGTDLGHFFGRMNEYSLVSEEDGGQTLLIKANHSHLSLNLTETGVLQDGFIDASGNCVVNFQN